MKKDKIILIILIIIIIGIVIIINYYKSNENHDNETIQCIAEKTKLIVSRTCGHCANQKEILGENLDLFEILYVDDDPTLFDKYEIRGVPTWIINQESYPGVKSIERLKELTDC